MSWPPPFSRMTVRWRLALAFLSVSVVPVLFSSFFAAQVIAISFERNLESWLGDAARFMAEDSTDARREAERAVAILAAGLQAGDVRDEGLFAASAQLLASVGYDVVVVYDDDRHVLRRLGDIGDARWLPLDDSSGLFPVTLRGSPSMLVGAAHAVQAGERTLHVFIADVINKTYVDLSRAISSLNVQVLRVEGDRTFLLDDSGAEVTLPPGVLVRLQAGEASVTANLAPEDELAAGFAPILDASGQLVGIITCRLSRDVAYLAHIRAWSLFVALSICAGLISLVVGLLLSKRLTGPLRDLLQGLREVREGNYGTRLKPAAGGQELEELATGFNDMAAQLDVLRQRETEMRRREQFAALGEAAAAIAHEIRNPLGIIKTSSQVLRMKQQLPEASDRLVGFVLDEVGRIDQLVQDLLDYVRPADMTLGPLDLFQDVVRRTMDFATPEMQRRNITVSVVPPQGQTPIHGNAARLHQALLNLVLNAADAMPAGGRLTVMVWREGASVVLSVEDTGGGISEAMRTRLFEPFVTDKPRGTGLGLAKVWSVMEQHGGTVTFHSEPEEGTTFLLTFPLATENGS
jgi:two-component system, NtrC family, sensor histidine kinase HydH